MAHPRLAGFLFTFHQDKIGQCPLAKDSLRARLYVRPSNLFDTRSFDLRSALLKPQERQDKLSSLTGCQCLNLL
jgi:hypothetical protein